MEQTFFNPTVRDNVMILSGSGQVKAIPDLAVLQLGVQTTGLSLESIQNENAQINQAVIQALKQLGVTELQTHQYSIDKQYEYVDGQQLDKGYSVRNLLELSTSDLAMVGTIIDTAVKNGANIVNFIRFEVTDAEQYYLDALNLAIANAYAKAYSISDKLGIHLYPFPRRIDEKSAPPVPYLAVGMREGAYATPIETGTNLIEASVTVEFIY
jgi:uncharacterized protein YggE